MRINKKYETVIRSVLMASGMSFIMSCAITFINTGYDSEFIERWLSGFSLAVTVAIPTSIVMGKMVSKLLPYIVEK